MSRRLKLFLLAVVVFLYWAGLYLYVPTLPTYIQSKTGSLAVVGGILSMYGLWQAIVRLPIGIGADWLGRRKPFIIGGLALVGIGAWMLGTSNTSGSLTVARAITGMAAGTWVPLVVFFSSLFPPKEAVRATAILNFVGFGGRMVATAMTGSLNMLGGYSLSFNLSVVVAAAAIVTMLLIREERSSATPPSVGDVGALVVRSDVLLPSVMSTVTHYAIFATTFAFLPIVAKDLGANDVVQSVLVTMNIALGLLGSLVVSAVVDRVGTKLLLYVSMAMMAVGVGVLAAAPSLEIVFLAQFFVGLGFGISYPVQMGMSIRFVSDRQRTSAMGLFTSVYSIGMFGGPWISGLIAEAVGIRQMLTVTAVACLLVGMLLTWWLVRTAARKRVELEQAVPS
jgi:MFS family permease